MAAMDLGATLAVQSGLLWVAPNIPEAVRDMADDLERRRDNDPPREPRPTLGALLPVISRPSTTN